MDSEYKIGSVLHYYCYVASKNKYHVVVCTEPELLTVLINTHLNNFVKNNPSLVACNAPIKQDDHSFLSHDSYVSCCDVYTGPRYGDKVDFVGYISKTTWRRIMKAVANSPTMSRRHKSWILDQ